MMRFILAFLVALVVLVAAPPASASTAPEPSLPECGSTNPGSCAVGALGSVYNSLPKPHEWVMNTWETIKTAKLPQAITGLAMIVLLFGIIWNGIQIANGAYLGNLSEFGVRLLLSVWLVLASGSIGSTVRSTWIDAYRWGLTTFTAPAFERAAQETQMLGNHVSNVAIATGTLAAGGGLLAGGVRAAGSGAGRWAIAKGAAQGGLGAARGSVNTALSAGSWLMNMTMPIVLTYYVAVMGTGFGALLASILIPLSGAMLIFSGGAGAQWISNWFRATSAALFSVAFVPLVVAGAMEIGFTGPAREYNRKYQEIQTRVTSQMESINQEMNQKIGPNLNVFNPAEVGAAIQSALSVIQAQIASWFEMAMALFWAILMLIIGIIAAMYFLRTAQGWVIQFVGGVSTIAKPTNGKASVPSLAGVSLPSFGGSGGGRGSGEGSDKGSTPNGASVRVGVPDTQPSGGSSTAAQGSPKSTQPGGVGVSVGAGESGGGGAASTPGGSPKPTQPGGVGVSVNAGASGGGGAPASTPGGAPTPSSTPVSVGAGTGASGEPGGGAESAPVGGPGGTNGGGAGERTFPQESAKWKQEQAARNGAGAQGVRVRGF